jgi:hypothetical protein
VPFVVDIGPYTSRHGRPVLGPEAITDAEFDLLLVAVGKRGARDSIREDIRRLRPDLVEGRDWFALA